MANALPNKELQTNGTHGPAHGAGSPPETTKAAGRRPLPHGLMYWDEDDDEDLVSATKVPPVSDTREQAETSTVLETSQIELFRVENADLRQLVAELQQLVDEAHRAEHSWVEQQKEYESLLEEKSEVIRSLHQRVKEYEEQASVPPPPGEDELIALSDELERERCKLQQDRRELEDESRQLKEDEETLMKQMREMEVSMSRERAELARQRSELQRLHAEIRHELELAARDAALRDRLLPLQRRHQEMLHRKGGAPGQPAVGPAPEAPPQTPKPANGSSGRDSGLLRRLFRPGK